MSDGGEQRRETAPSDAERRGVKGRSPIDRDLIEPNAENRYEVTRKDLPLSCPMPGMALWSSHPRVYLPIEKSGVAKCPYCGADFVLTD